MHETCAATTIFGLTHDTLARKCIERDEIVVVNPREVHTGKFFTCGREGRPRLLMNVKCYRDISPLHTVVRETVAVQEIIF